MITFRFGGETYVAKPTFAAVAAIEQAVGRSIFVIGQEIASGQAQFQHLALVLHQMLLTANARHPASEVGETLVGTGVKDLLGPASQFCLAAFVGPQAFDDRPTKPAVATGVSQPPLQ